MWHGVQAWVMHLTSALMALGILAGGAVVCVVLWDALLSPVVTFALKLAFYAGIVATAFVLATMLF